MPAPSIVLLFEVVGFGEVLQQTPLAVTAAPPSLDILPPHVALVVVIIVGIVVVNVGTTICIAVLNTSSSP